MKVKIELDLTPEEAKELFVPGDKQTEFMTKTYDAYTKALNGMMWDHIDPYSFVRNMGEKEMKIGLSLSRCVRDIVEANVLFEDVLVIIARTDFDPHNDVHWQNIWDGYLYGGFSHPEWMGCEDQEDEFRNVCKTLYDYGKLHQPRQYPKSYAPRLPYHWLECTLPPEELEKHPGAKSAWENFKVIAKLTGLDVHE